MKKYSCEFIGEGQEYIPNGEFQYIEAKSPEHAGKLFSEKFKRKEFPFIKARYGFLGVSGAVIKNEFYVKSDKVAEEKAVREQIESQKAKEVEQNENLSTDELLAKIIQMQKQQSELFENQIKNQNEQTESLNKIRWAIIALLIFIVGQWIALKMKWGL